MTHSCPQNFYCQIIVKNDFMWNYKKKSSKERNIPLEWLIVLDWIHKRLSQTSENLEKLKIPVEVQGTLATILLAILAATFVICNNGWHLKWLTSCFFIKQLNSDSCFCVFGNDWHPRVIYIIMFLPWVV